ncbi:hypothetical protein DA2_0095 [Desulfovibrio sp. A2]|nr:hypothetical protein DA2_0095 [Desulfovibrio sp. A2]
MLAGRRARPVRMSAGAAAWTRRRDTGKRHLAGYPRRQWIASYFWTMHTAHQPRRAMLT